MLVYWTVSFVAILKAECSIFRERGILNIPRSKFRTIEYQIKFQKSVTLDTEFHISGY